MTEVSDDGKTTGISPGERRELRSVVKAQYKVLRSEVERRVEEMKAEIEAELLERYRREDQAVAEATKEVRAIFEAAWSEIRGVTERLQQAHPDLTVEAQIAYGGRLIVDAENKTRTQLRRAALAHIPHVVGNAKLALDRQEVDLLRELSASAIESTEAEKFLRSIPTVGQLVPQARLAELEEAAAIIDAAEGDR